MNRINAIVKSTETNAKIISIGLNDFDPHTGPIWDVRIIGYDNVIMDRKLVSMGLETYQNWTKTTDVKVDYEYVAKDIVTKIPTVDFVKIIDKNEIVAIENPIVTTTTTTTSTSTTTSTTTKMPDIIEDPPIIDPPIIDPPKDPEEITTTTTTEEPIIKEQIKT